MINHNAPKTAQVAFLLSAHLNDMKPRLGADWAAPFAEVCDEMYANFEAVKEGTGPRFVSADTQWYADTTIHVRFMDNQHELVMRVQEGQGLLELISVKVIDFIGVDRNEPLEIFSIGIRHETDMMTGNEYYILDDQLVRSTIHRLDIAFEKLQYEPHVFEAESRKLLKFGQVMMAFF